MERKSIIPRKGRTNSESETFPILVNDYEVIPGADPTQNYVHGVRLDTGDTIRVSLRKVEQKPGSRFKRSEITDFAAPRKSRQHPGTVPGGTLLVQEAYLQTDGSYSARWLQSLSHTPGEAEVFIAAVHSTPVMLGKKSEAFPSGRPYAVMTFLHDGLFDHLSAETQDALKLTKPFPVDSTSELREALTTLLDDGIGVGVRVSQPDGFDAMYVKRNREATTEQNVDGFMRDIESMADQIDDGSLTCEVIPYSNLWAGPSTVDVMSSNAVFASRIRQFNTERTDARGRTHPVPVYRAAIVAVRLTEPDDHGKRAVFFTHVEPIWSRQPVHGLVGALCYAQTEHLAPVPPKLDQLAQSQAQSQQPQGDQMDPGNDTGSADFDATDDDLMGAAGGEARAPAQEPAEEAAPSKPAARGRYAGRRMATT